MRDVLYIGEAVGEGDVLRDVLTEAGCAVTVTTAAEAMRRLDGEYRTPELAVLELAADPDVETCALLASMLPTSPLLVVAPEAFLERAFEAGADDCILAPVRRAEAVARVRAALRDQAARTRGSKRERRLTDRLRELQREKHELERLACVDVLTGVANRRHALAMLQAEWKRATREGLPMSLVMVDLDYFHAFNETYGHLGGDDCLRQVADAMAKCLRRPSDFLGRYGGEEFVAVLGNTDATGARLVAERMRGAVEALAIPHASSACAPVVTMSVGFAGCRPNHDQDPTVLVAAADRALLTAKTNGRNRITGDAPPPAPRPRLASQPWRRFPVVVADPWFASRIPMFLAATRSDLRASREACHEGSFDRILEVASGLRTAAADHAIEMMAELAGVLERAARGEDREAITRVLDELDLYVQYVQVTYRRPDQHELDQAG